jgi:predicted ABC-type ATPase
LKRIGELDRLPVLVAIAGPIGAGKTTFYEAHIAPAGLRFVNADVIAHQLGSDPYAAAKAADVTRRAMVRRKASFAFETLFSDPVGDKLKFLQDAAAAGDTVVLCFVGIASPKLSEERVAKR